MVHLKITFEKEDHLNLNQTSISRFHVNLTGSGQIIATSHDLGPQNVAEVSLNFFISGRSRYADMLKNLARLEFMVQKSGINSPVEGKVVNFPFVHRVSIGFELLGFQDETGFGRGVTQGGDVVFFFSRGFFYGKSKGMP